MKNISAIIVLLSFNALAQYQIPGGGSIAMPPGCQAQYDFANYCVASGIVPIDLNIYDNSLIETILKNPEGNQCIRASNSWQNCSRYLEAVIKKRVTSECRDYWDKPFLSGASTGNAVAQAELQRLTSECGGITR